MFGIELKDTIAPMCSADYKDRFVAEYIQLKIRYERLKAFNTKIKAALLSFGEECEVEEPKHDCPAELLREQQRIMGELLHVLEVRAVIEGIDLDGCMKMLYGKAREREEDEAERIPLSEYADDGDMLIEAFRRCVVSGVTTDKENERIFEAAVNLLLEMRGLKDKESSSSTVEDGPPSPILGKATEELPEGLLSLDDTLKTIEICEKCRDSEECIADCPCLGELGRGCKYRLKIQSLSYHLKKIYGVKENT